MIWGIIGVNFALPYSIPAALSRSIDESSGLTRESSGLISQNSQLFSSEKLAISLQKASYFSS